MTKSVITLHIDSRRSFSQPWGSKSILFSVLTLEFSAESRNIGRFDTEVHHDIFKIPQAYQQNGFYLDSKLDYDEAEIPNDIRLRAHWLKNLS